MSNFGNGASAKHDELYGVVDDIMVLARTIISAIKDDEPERVHDILPAESLTSLAKAAADAKARHKFR